MVKEQEKQTMHNLHKNIIFIWL